MKHLRYIFFFSAFIFFSGCMTARQHQSLPQEQVLLIIQEQKIQTEIQQQIQNRLIELEKILHQIDNSLSAAIIQRDEFLPYKKTEMSIPSVPDNMTPANIKESNETVQFSPVEFVRNTKENSQKIKESEPKLMNQEGDHWKNKIQTEIDTVKKREERDIESENKNLRKKDEKYKNISPNDLYEQALEEFNKPDYQKALSLWVELTGNFPEHKMASNAYFWQGEAFYQMQDFENAVLEYNKVIKEYPGSNKYPAALLKCGLSCFALNKSAEGKLRLDELIKKFPDRAEAKRATIFLNNR
jgi:tol-pal system protein YbgF